MHIYQTQNQALYVLQQVVKHTESVGVLRVLDVHVAAKLGSLKANVLIAHHDLHFLFPALVSFRPLFVVLP